MPAISKRLEPVLMENRRLMFRNFSGEEGPYNNKGDRNFNVVLDPDEAESLAHDGWNVKYLKPRDPQEEPLARLEITVKFGRFPPTIVLITSRGKTTLPEELVGIFDWAELANVDLIFRPYYWDINGKQGVTAYLKTFYGTIVEDPLALKYKDLPDYPLPSSAQDSIVQASSEILAIERGEDTTPF